jgi:hypothetical protein
MTVIFLFQLIFHNAENCTIGKLENVYSANGTHFNYELFIGPNRKLIVRSAGGQQNVAECDGFDKFWAIQYVYVNKKKSILILICFLFHISPLVEMDDGYPKVVHYYPTIEEG